MKTVFSALLLLLISATTFAQDERTSFDQLAVVATHAGNAVPLTWTKGDEDIAYFIIERSTDGVDFKQCAIMFLSDDPDFTEYKFRDRLIPNSQGMIYRIGLVNPQRRVYYLPVKKLGLLTAM